jgi:PilZ domain
MDFLAWTKHLMNRGPIRISERDPASESRPGKDRRRHPRFSFDAPLEYSTTDGSRPRGAYAGNVSEKGLLIYSVDNLPIAAELKIVVFYPDGYQLGNFEVLVKVVWKDHHFEKEWKGLKYGVEVIHISETDQIKLREILLRASAREKNFVGEIAESVPKAVEAQQNNWVA